jgi:hypothetical protein
VFSEQPLRQRRIDPDGHLDDVPRLNGVFDQADAILRRLTGYWKTFRQKEDPQTSTAAAALEAVLYEGRQVRIHVLYNGRVAGGGLTSSAREQFATVILARVGTNTWQRLAPIAGPAPKPSVHPGRVHVVQDGTAHQTQALLLTDAEAADWLTATAAGERPRVGRTNGPRGISLPRGPTRERQPSVSLSCQRLGGPRVSDVVVSCRPCCQSPSATARPGRSV